MLSEIKKELLRQPEKIKALLEYFDYCNVTIRQTYISCGRAIDASAKSIVIRLEHNDWLYVTDYARNINQDIFAYISSQRKIEFVEILTVIKNILGITDYDEHFGNKGIFGGFYERIRKRNTVKTKTYDNSVLDKYIPCGNIRFLEDNISLDAQRFFHIMYDVESQGIIIPIYNQLGFLMGAKARFNYDVEDGEMKYFYPLPCQMSQTLYGYSQNYNYLADGTVLIGEAEKLTLQCYSYGYRNVVSLGSGSISTKQVQMLYELNPKRVIFLHDVGYELENIMRNIDKVRRYSRFSEIELGYWDFFGKDYKNKVSPTDMGKEKFEYILNNEIKMIGDDEKDDEL